MESSLIAICVATYQRPRGLEEFLRSLMAMEIDGLDVHLIIADNDSAAAARPVVDAIGPSLTFPVTYVVEPTRGLAAVRNRLVAEARVINADFIAFVDDDETVSNDWLKLLYTEIHHSDAAATTGPALSLFEDGVPPSIRNCFMVRRKSTGTIIERFGTNNVLISMNALDAFDGPFDLRLNLTGGEDTFLSAQFVDAGFRITWCDEAITQELVPSSRANARWILKRAFRSGTTTSKIARWTNPSPITTIKHLGVCVAIIAKHGLMMIPNAVTRRDLLLFRAKCIVAGIGGIAGMVSTRPYSYQEYKTIHGS